MLASLLWPSWIQIFGARLKCGSAASKTSARSLARMTWSASATLMQCDSDSPTSFVLISATTPPTLLMPSQAAM